jgi:hypothetical protein
MTPQWHTFKLREFIPGTCYRLALTNLLQTRVLGLGVLQDGDVGVGVCPEGEEIFVGGECPDAGGICIGIQSARAAAARLKIEHGGAP